MSVAELLGREETLRPEGDTRRTNYFPGLNIDHLGTAELSHVGSPRYYSAKEAMAGNTHVIRDFRLKGYTGQNMVSPRQPLLSKSPDDRQRNEDQMRKYFGKSSFFDPDRNDPVFVNDPRLIAKPRIDEGHRGMQYGADDYDRGYPHPRPLHDPFHGDTNHRADMESEKMRKQKIDMDLDIQQLKARQMREKQERDEEKKKNYEILTKTFPWDQKSQGHGGPRGSGSNRRRKFLETDFSPRNQEGFKDKRETDLFLDTLGGPGGTVLRTGTGSPNLADPKFMKQQQNFQAATSPRVAGGMTPAELHDYSHKLEQVSEERKIQKQQKRIQDLRDKIEDLKENQGIENYRPQGYINERLNQRRSLDLENTLGGAGAPVKNPEGKKVTRMPITLRRDDYGESKITEDIPGKPNFHFDFTEEESKPYYPWGGQGGGAPIRDREGKVKTMIYGQLEGKHNYSGDFRRAKRRQEVLYNELKEGERQQKQNKEELDRYMKAPQAELAEVLAAGRVGKPRRDEITGEMSQHHLSNSDVTLVKMNHQPKPIDEKKSYHDELVRMAEERQHLKQLEKLKERQESNAHFRNMDSTWGAFGGGAPKHGQIRKKANLTNSLFYPDISEDETVPSHAMTFDPHDPPTGLGSFMLKSPIDRNSKLNTDPNTMMFASQNSSPRYVKSTINSSHKNMFETTNEKRIMRAQAYNQPLAPYATRGAY